MPKPPTKRSAGVTTGKDGRGGAAFGKYGPVAVVAAGGAAAAWALNRIARRGGPSWDPLPLDPDLVDHMAPAGPDTSFPDAGTPGDGPRQTQPADIVRTVRPVMLDGEDAEPTQVEVTRPAAPGRHPVIVFAHGAGTGGHEEFAEHTEQLAQRGIACVVADKAPEFFGLKHRDYEEMGRRYALLGRWARTQDFAEPDRTGYYGESEGAWIVPLAIAEFDPDAAFAALISAPVMSMRRQGLFAGGAYLANTRVPAGVRRVLPRLFGTRFPFGWAEYLDFDVRPYQRRLTCPVFVAYGVDDASMPQVEGAAWIEQDLAEAGNDQLAVRYYRGNHGLRVPGPDEPPDAPVAARQCDWTGKTRPLNPDFARDLAAWVSGLPGAARPRDRVAGVAPSQPFQAGPPPQLPARGQLAVQALAGAAALGALGVPAAVGMARGARRLRGKRGEAHDAGRPGSAVMAPALPAGTAGPLAALAAGAAATWAAHGTYLKTAIAMSLDYRRDDRLITWGYRGVRALAAASAGAAGWLLERCLRSGRPARGARARLVLGAGGAGLLQALAAYWGATPRPEPPGDFRPRSFLSVVCD
ncbi:MAG: hypothetical protein LBM66_08130 [Bifidobacteriaceae bacterium]|nr:hypothetical protein [Bifidobacteriaceae bacterium]